MQSIIRSCRHLILQLKRCRKQIIMHRKKKDSICRSRSFIRIKISWRCIGMSIFQMQKKPIGIRKRWMRWDARHQERIVQRFFPREQKLPIFYLRMLHIMIWRNNMRKKEITRKQSPSTGVDIRKEMNFLRWQCRVFPRYM